jgi:hypothetical protein
MIFLTLVVSHARAACIPGGDGDGDGVQKGFDVVCDCDDGDATRYPNSQEVVGNGVDEDCDKDDALARKMMERSFSSPSWTWTGTVAATSDGVKVGSAILGGGSITRTFSQAMSYGKVHAVLDVTGNSGSPFAKCYLDVKTNGQFGIGPIVTATWQITGNGTGSLTTGALAVKVAPRTLKEVAVRCAPGAYVTLDWLSIQNTDDVVGPAGEMSVAWDDVDIPGGGLTTTVVRVSSGDELYAAADLGGVSYKDPLDATGTPWATINGTAPYALTDQSSVNVWDVLPTDWGDVFALSGRLDGTVLAGGLYRYDTAPDEWSLLADTDEDDAAGDEYEVGGYGRYSECGVGTVKPYGGGKLLVQEPGMQGIYIANGDDDDLGVAFWDGTNVCALPTATALPDGYIGALARVETDPTGLPALLVGYRGMGGATDSLYLCELPMAATDLDGDGLINDPEFSCSDTGVVSCAAITDGLGMDVRDIEVDPLLPNVVYIANGGHDPTATDCDDGVNGLYQFEVTDDTFGALDGDLFDDLTTGLTDLGSGFEITGVSLDPDGDFLFAFVPSSQDSGYDEDRIYRVAYADMGTGAWVPMNENLDQATRAASLDLSGGWLEATTVVKEAPYPAYFAPGHAIDAVWFQAYDSPAWNSCRGDAWYAAVSTDLNAWRVAGLDDLDDSDCNGVVDWDPEDDTDWVFWPEPDTAESRTWQTAVVNDIAEDLDGNLWMPSSDHGLFMQPAAGGPAELDCLWDFFNAGGNLVSVGEDGSVWVGFFDQGVNSTAPAHETGIFRTLDGGGIWEYQGAGVTNANGYDEDGLSSQFNEYPWCKDGDTTHEATPFGDVVNGDNGNVFNGNSESTTASLTSTWGNVSGLAAVNEVSAVAAFQSYTTTSAVDGRLAYTVDSGVNWTAVTFDGDWDANPATTDDCEAYDFFDKVKGVALVHRGVDTYADDTDSDGDADDWQLDFFVASRDADTTDASNGHCALARVTVTSTSTTISTSWTWFPLDRASGTIDCEVDEENMRGVDTLPWSDEVVVWGFYDYNAGTHAGGACVINIDYPTTVTELVDPAVYQFSIADVVPAPYVNDLLFVAPYIDAGTWRQCHEAGAGDCPDLPYPMFAERAGSAWTLTTLGSFPPSLVATAANWTDFNDPALLYATEGAGAWRGSLTW